MKGVMSFVSAELMAFAIDGRVIRKGKAELEAGAEEEGDGEPRRRSARLLSAEGRATEERRDLDLIGKMSR